MEYFLLGIFLILTAAYGVKCGKEIAVDKTKVHGHFEAYGKKYRAVELED